MSLPSADLVNFVFEIFRNRCRRLNFAVVFPLNNGKYQNIFFDANFCLLTTFPITSLVIIKVKSIISIACNVTDSIMKFLHE